MALIVPAVTIMSHDLPFIWSVCQCTHSSSVYDSMHVLYTGEYVASPVLVIFSLHVHDA